jgi:hypothetical protein
MLRLAVGELYNPNRKSWPDGGMQLRITAAGNELALFFANPTGREVNAVRTGAAEFAWVDSEQVAVLACTFADGIPWSDTTFNPHRDKDSAVPPGGESSQLVLRVVLVDAATGIVKTLRAITWPPGFTAVVRNSIMRMLASPFNPGAADQALHALYQRYPSTEELVARRADVRCTGGTTQEQSGPGPDASPAAVDVLPAAELGSPAEIIAKQLGRYLVAGRTYLNPLPPELQAWYCYTADGGHSILVAVAAHYKSGGDPDEFLVTAPVKAVQRAGWQLRDGFVVADLEYDPHRGLTTDESDDEY